MCQACLHVYVHVYWGGRGRCGGKEWRSVLWGKGLRSYQWRMLWAYGFSSDEPLVYWIFSGWHGAFVVFPFPLPPFPLYPSAQEYSQLDLSTVHNQYLRGGSYTLEVKNSDGCLLPATTLIPCSCGSCLGHGAHTVALAVVLGRQQQQQLQPQPTSSSNSDLAPACTESSYSYSLGLGIELQLQPLPALCRYLNPGHGFLPPPSPPPVLNGENTSPWI